MNADGPLNAPADKASRQLTRMLVLGLLLIAAWLLWSGLFQGLLLFLGAVSCALTLYIVHRMGYFDKEAFVFRYKLGLLGFWAWLFREIVKSSLEVTRVVLRRDLKIEPEVVALHLIRLVRELRELTGAGHGLCPDQVGDTKLFVSVLPRMDVQHEIDEAPVEARARPHENGSAIEVMGIQT